MVAFFTKGTIYSNTSIEFKISLWKNVLVSIESYLSASLTKGDILVFVHKPAKEVFDLVRKNLMVMQLGLKEFGKNMTDTAIG